MAGDPGSGAVQPLGHEAIAEVAAAAGLAPSDEQIDQLARYAALLQRWNTTYNLTAVREPAQVLSHHIADCLAVVAPLARQREGASTGTATTASGRVLDVGSGGGLPGVVLAILLPGLQVHCVDTVGKKAAFVRQVAGLLQLPRLQALHARVEQLKPPAPFDVICSRAFASLADFTRWTAPLLAPGGVWMAMKGRVPDEEIAALPPAVEVFHVEPLTVPGLDGQRCIVWMRPRAGSPARSPV